MALVRPTGTRARAGRALALSMAATVALAAGPVAPRSAQAEVRKKLSAKQKKKATRYAKRAKKAYAKKKYDEAIAAFELAYDIDDDPRHLFNIGRCYEKAGELFRAMEFVQRYVEAVTDEEEKEDAQELHAILRKQLLKAYGELLLESEPDQAGVRLEGEDGAVRRMKTPVATWLPAGTWKVRVAAPDKAPWEAELVIVIGETLAQEIMLEAVKAEPPPPPPEETPEAEPEPAPVAADEPAPAEPLAAASEDRGGGWLPAGVLAAGGALLVAGAAFAALGAQATAEVDDFEKAPGSGTQAEVQDAIDRSHSHTLVGNILLGAGLIAAGAGGYLYLTDEAVALGVGWSW